MSEMPWDDSLSAYLHTHGIRTLSPRDVASLSQVLRQEIDTSARFLADLAEQRGLIASHDAEPQEQRQQTR